MAKILLLVADDGYQIKEYEDTKKAIEESGHIVITASKEKGTIISHMGTKDESDISIKDINIADYDGFYLIGGQGAIHYLDNEYVHNIIKNVFESTNKPFGAICISPRILIKSGVMNGIKMTGWNNDQKLNLICKNAGCKYQIQDVVRDGRIVTAEGPLSAYDFGLEICKDFN